MRYYLKSIDEYKVSKVQRINKNNGKLYYYYAIRKFQFYDTNYEKRIIHDITSPTIEGLYDKCKRLRNVKPNINQINKNKKLVSEVCDKWLNCDREFIVQKESKEVYSYRIEKYYKKYFKDKSFYDLKRIDILQFIYWVKNQGLQPSTVRQIVLTFKMICNYAYKNHYCTSDLFTGVALPKSSRISNVKPLSYEEQNRLFTLFKDDEYGDIFLVLLLAGMRVRELLGAPMQNFDEEHNNLYIDRQLSVSKDKKNNYTFKMCTKNGQSYYCNLIDIVKEVIKKRIALNKERQKNDNYNNYLNLIFTNDNGEPIEYQNLTDHFQKLMKMINREDAVIHTKENICL